MVLPVKIGSIRASFAVDTGASVNVLSAASYSELKRASRGSRWPLRPPITNLQGVSSVPIDILGIVRLPIKLGNNTTPIRTDFYVISNFSLPSDGLLGLRTMKDTQLEIQPDLNCVKFRGKTLKAMEIPRRLISSNRTDPKSFTDTQEISVIHNAQEKKDRIWIVPGYFN